MYQYRNSIQDLINLLENKDHLIDKLDFLTDDQKQTLKDFFKKYPNYEGKIDWNNKDLAWEDFQPLLKLEGKSKSQAKQSGISGLTEGKDYKVIATSSQKDKREGTDWTIYYPLNHLASKTLASSKTPPAITGKWCISMNDDHYWREYTAQDTDFFFVIIQPGPGNFGLDGAKFAISRKKEYYSHSHLGTHYNYNIFSAEDNNIGNATEEKDFEIDSFFWSSADQPAYKKLLGEILKQVKKTIDTCPNYMLETAGAEIDDMLEKKDFFNLDGTPKIEKFLRYEDLYELCQCYNDPETYDLSFTPPANYPCTVFPSSEDRSKELFTMVWREWDEAPACGCISKIDLSKTKVEKIEEQAFEELMHIKEFIFPKTLWLIGDEAFVNGSIEVFDFRNTRLAYILSSAFVGNAIKTIYLPKTLKLIEANAFTYCYNFTDLYVDMPSKDFKAVTNPYEYDPALPSCFDLGQYKRVTVHATDGDFRLDQLWQGTPGNKYTSAWFKPEPETPQVQKASAPKPSEGDEKELIPF